MTDEQEVSVETDDTAPSGPTFLVVDDDPMVRRIVAKGLASLDPLEVLEVEDGLAAQPLLLEKPIDVVVTDVMMPNMSGLELMKWAQEHAPGPLWIVLSGLETFDAAVDALQLGAFDYLAKPPEVQRVRVAVRNALDQIELVRERARLYEQLQQSNEQLAEKVDQLEQVCKVLEEQAAVIQADLDRAEIIQRALLPRDPPELDGWCVETLYRSGSSVGGDFYDVILLDRDHVGLVIADASGHGVAAAMLSVLFKLRLDLMGPQNRVLSPSVVLDRLNERLFETVTAPGAFITAAYVLLDRRIGQARMASAGHPPCVHESAEGNTQLLERTGPALGLTADASYDESVLKLEVGDRLLLYTDGVLRPGAESESCQEIIKILGSEMRREEVPGALYRAATRDAADRDDITMILLERREGESHYDDTPETDEERPAAPAAEIQPELMQGAGANGAFVSISGTATWTCSHTLLEAAGKLLQTHKRLTVDLADCDYLDSTCLGTLHEIVMSQPDAVELQGVPACIREQFEELSMAGVLSHILAESKAPPDIMLPLQKVDVDMGEEGQRVLSAHEALSALSPKNREVFKGVVESLRSDLGSNG